MKTITKIALLALAISSMSAFADIPVLSVDNAGNETTTMITDADYEKVTSLQADTSAQAAEDQLEVALAQPHLTLKGIQVGLELFTSVGPTPLKIGAAFNQQFYFEIKK